MTVVFNIRRFIYLNLGFIEKFAKVLICILMKKRDLSVRLGNVFAQSGNRTLSIHINDVTTRYLCIYHESKWNKFKNSYLVFRLKSPHFVNEICKNAIFDSIR